MAIHPTAIIDKSAELDASVEVGAYAIVEAHARIGPHVRLYPHAYVSQHAAIDEGCQIHPFAVIGHLPQDTKYDGSPSFTRLGANCTIREGAQVHRGTTPGSTTTVGRNCFLMANAHIGHNCTVGDNVTMANSAALGGHAAVGARAFVSACAIVHQFTRIGELVMLGGGTRVTSDVPPFMSVTPGGVSGVNVVGLRRAGFSSAERQEIRQIHHLLYRRRLPFPKALAQIAELVQTAPGRTLLEFLRSPTKRGLIRSIHSRLRAGEVEVAACES